MAVVGGVALSGGPCLGSVRGAAADEAGEEAADRRETGTG